MREGILKSIKESVLAVQVLMQPEGVAFVEAMVDRLIDCFRAGNKLLVAGNGGSLCDAMHFAEELTGQFRRPRPALPAIALADSAHLTCTANDMGFDTVFSRGIEALGKPGDVFVGLTTSGNSPNMIRAFAEAKHRKLYSIAFLGKDGGRCKGMADLELIISGFAHSDRIQEAHMAAIHIVIEQVEALLFAPSRREALVVQ